ncbi:ferredoxin reductase family protein [Kribbella kalugense]|uniref:Putative ferric reductase n=1 Tax=Kribbella kalugense TaxID=2512221 RepID=A0A4R7ZX85_9ACTN|nr:ferric reductase-like transmembrane domain-containing protein [Kribbella kalugense]TDW21508.1 putative ferric reductase [Kribbella kalugense]
MTETLTARAPRLMVNLVGGLAIVLTTWIWVRGGGLVQTFVYPEYLLESQALYTGLLSQVLMILMVLLMARIPWVEQSWGHDVLARRHKWLGYASFWLAIVHTVLFALDRIDRQPSEWAAALWQLFVRDSWMLWATIGTLLIIGVVITSIQIARRRLRYESWHLLHLYSYLGMAFVLPHEIFDGTHFHETWTQVFWWTMYFGSLGAVLFWRVIRPLWLSWRHQLVVDRVVAETPSACSIELRGRRLDRLRTRSGQFFIFRFLGSPGWTRGNPYSISAAPTSDRLRVTLEAAGDGATRARVLTPGSRVLIEGPYGTMTGLRRRHSKMVMIAAGVGVTPLRALLEDAPYQPGEATLIYRYTDDAIFLAELTRLTELRGVDLILLPGRRRDDGSWLPAGVPGTDAEALTRYVPDIASRDVFACGPVPWLRAVRRSARSAGVETRDFHYEDYAW